MTQQKIWSSAGSVNSTKSQRANAVVCFMRFVAVTPFMPSLGDSYTCIRFARPFSAVVYLHI